MKDTFRTTLLSAAVSAAVLVMAQPAEARCALISASVTGVAKITATERAEYRLRRAIDRTARDAGVKTVRVRNKDTACAWGQQLPLQNCTASAYVCH